MLQPASGFYIWVSLGIFCTLAYLAECGKCSLEGMCRPLDNSPFLSPIKNSDIGLQDPYSSYYGLNYGPGCQKKISVTGDVCSGSELGSFSSASYDSHEEELFPSRENSNVNRRSSEAGLPKTSSSFRNYSNGSWSSESFMFDLPDGVTLACFLNFRWLGHETSPSSVNTTDQIVLSPCGGHLLRKREPSFSSQNIEIEKSLSSEMSSPCLSISPKKLDWGHNYLYHPSVAFLRLKNICNKDVIEVYEPLSTDSQFYPFDYSEVVLGPGDVASISFVFLPKWLGSSSAELVLQTSLGGFLVQAEGRAVESPQSVVPLVGMDVSSSGWLSRKLSLTNPFNEAIHLEEITASLSVTGGSDTLFTEAMCRKQNPQGFDEHIFSGANKGSNGKNEQLDHVVMAIKPLNDWVISPHRTENIFEVAFSPFLEGKILGAMCMQLLRPLEGGKVTIVVPFEAALDKPATWKDTKAEVSASIEAVGSCNECETTISLSVRNNASHLLKVVRISEVTKSKKLLEINYMEGLLLFPGSVTQVALVTYNNSDVNSDLFVEMPDASMSCGLQILINDSSSPHLEVPCQEIFSICSTRQLDLQPYLPGNSDLSSRTGCLSCKKSPVLTKALGYAEGDGFMLQKWRDQSTKSGLYVLDDHELFFAPVPVGRYYAKSITVKNPSHLPVTVQLILNPVEVVDNCKPHYSHLQPPWSSNPIHHGSSDPSRYGFSMVENAVTEAFLHPHGTASLGPMFFHPSNRCEWKSSALIRNNLSGVEQLSLHGIGGLLSLILLEGSEPKHKIHFNMNLPSPLNLSYPLSIPSVEDACSGCRKPLLKKLFALNAGDFDVKVDRIQVSGAACGLGGFLVHNCKGFSLLPGESLELGISYQSDFSGVVVQRNLEFKLAAGILVVPMEATIPANMLKLCRMSIFYTRVKRCCTAMILAVVLMLLLFWFIMPHIMPSDSVDYLNRGDKTSIPLIRPKERLSISTLQRNQGNGKSVKASKMAHLKSLQRKEATSDLTRISARHRDLKQGIMVDHADCLSETADSFDATNETSFSPSLISESIQIKSSGKLLEPPPVCLTVKTRKDKRRRPKKRNGATSGLMAHIEVSSSQSASSSPSSPMSPSTTPSPKNTCSPSTLGQSSHESSSFICDRSLDGKANTFNPETVSPAGLYQNCSDYLFYTQQQPFCPRNTASKPMLSSSATFPGTGRSASGLPFSSASTLGISPLARAPGPKFHPQKAVQAKERANPEDRFTYDIWGNHLSGLHLMSRLDCSFPITLESRDGVSDSFFVRDPQQTLMTNSAPVPIMCRGEI